MTNFQRRMYEVIVKLHPAEFRNEFGREMALDFEDALASSGFAALCFDGLRRLGRQWAMCLLSGGVEQSGSTRPSLLAGQYAMVHDEGLSAVELGRGLVVSALVLGLCMSAQRFGPGHPARVAVVFAQSKASNSNQAEGSSRLGPEAAPSSGDWEKTAGGAMEFEVASVRLNSGPMEQANFRLSPDDAYTSTGGLLHADFSAVDYISFAYKIMLNREQFQTLVRNLPDWVQTDHYVIHARAADRDPTKDQMRLMMQALLKERFGLVVHFENQDTPVLEMTLAKPGTLGPKLHRHEDGLACDVAVTAGAKAKAADLFPSKCGGVEAENRPNQTILMGGRDTTLEMMASSFSSIGRLGRPVVDETGLTGKYDFTLNWAPEPGTFGAAPGAGPQDTPASDSQGTTFLEAVREQLGLKLKPGKAPVKSMVIDRIERPSEN